MSHEDAERARGVDVDVVDADRVLRNEPQLRREREELAVHLPAERGAEQNVRPGDQRRERVAIGAGGRDDDVAAGRFEHAVRRAALVDRPVDQDFRPARQRFAARAAYCISALTAL